MANSNIELIKALDKIRLGNLYVHNDELPGAAFSTFKVKTRKVYLVETLAVINALVDRGTMLLFGGHGGGKTTLAKYLGQVFFKLSKDEIEDCILRGHPQLTEEKILGSLDIAQLTRAKELNSQKKVDVIWNTFVDSPWKIIDELNRLSPYAQNILLSLLAESSVKYHNESKRLSNFSLFATMNPKDEGNFIMSLPFLDRFALALPITMPDYESLSTIGKKDKSAKQDDISAYLKDFDLKSVQDDVREIKYSEDAELFINVIISSYRICDRISKESNEIITVDKGLCKGCHFDAPEKVCNKIIHPLSVRVKEDLYRYGKALAWFLGDSEVKVEHIKTLAPFMIWHRSSLSKKFKKELSEKRFENSIFSLNIELDSTKEIVDFIENEFEGLKPYLKQFDKIKKGKLTEQLFDEFIAEIKQTNKNFLIIKKEIIPILIKEYAPVYNEIIAYNTKITNANDLDSLNSIKVELSNRYDIPNRQFLADVIERERRKIGVQSLSEMKFKIPYDIFIETVSKECLELHKLVISRFHNDFNPTIRRVEFLSDLGDSDFNLTMEKVSEGGGRFGLRFIYRGSEKNPIFNFLNKYNVN
jgi:MoxR-like ATPase